MSRLRSAKADSEVAQMTNRLHTPASMTQVDLCGAGEM